MKHTILLEIVQFQFSYNSVNEYVGLPDIDVLIRFQLFWCLRSNISTLLIAVMISQQKFISGCGISLCLSVACKTKNQSHPQKKDIQPRPPLVLK